MKEYCLEIIVQAQDIDELNHVNNVRYFDYLQQAAIAHWHNEVPKEVSDGIRWVVKKHEIEYFKPAFLGETLKIKTWIESFSGVVTDRHYQIYRENDLLIKAHTIWVALDTATMKPKRISPEILKVFFD